jgi:hypothetical protein
VKTHQGLRYMSEARLRYLMKQHGSHRGWKHGVLLSTDEFRSKPVFSGGVAQLPTLENINSLPIRCREV